MKSASVLCVSFAGVAFLIGSHPPPRVEINWQSLGFALLTLAWLLQ